MIKTIESIPNFSTSDEEYIIPELLKCVKNMAGVILVDYSCDKDHNRTVFTIAGEPEQVSETIFLLCSKAAELIDLNKHIGVHPRMGAVDVVPFVPLRGVSIEECIELSKQLGQRVGDELEIPVFLYEYSAIEPYRSNLADIRRGGFENMPEKMKNEKWKADYGPNQPHKTAGVVAIGARKPLIAFNVNLDTDNVEIAKQIAKSIRGSSGGYSGCKAIGLKLDKTGKAQVSMNITDYNVTPLYRVVEAIKFEAARWGVKISGTELIGAAPAKAFIDSAEYYLQIEDFKFDNQVLENKLFGGMI